MSSELAISVYNVITSEYQNRYELVIRVYNVITSEYQNRYGVKNLDCCVGIIHGKFLCKQFFSFNILLQTIISCLFSVQ